MGWRPKSEREDVTLKSKQMVREGSKGRLWWFLIDCGATLPGLDSVSATFQVMMWASYLTSLCLHSLIYKKDINRVNREV